MTASTETSPLTSALIGAVLTGSSIPAHDETFDLAEEVGNALTAFQAYVSEVRSPEQGKAALLELVAALNVAVVTA